MKLSIVRWHTCLVLVACLSIVSSLSFSPKKRWNALRDSNRLMKNSVSSWSRTFANESRSALTRLPIKRTNPMNLIRKWLPSKQKNLLYNSSDPLNAYPNRIDLLVHAAFQHLARIEVNNAATVRAGLRVLRIGSIIGTILNIVGLAVGLGVAIPTAIARRKDNLLLPDDRIDWAFVNDAAQTIIQAIQSGQLKYEL